MTAQVVVLLGPVRSGKTNELVGRYRTALETASPGGLDRAVWLAPNGRTAAAVREWLVRDGLRACLRPAILTFNDLTTQILFATSTRLNRLTPVLQRELLRRVVTQALDDGKLSFFADAAKRPGFVQLLTEHIAELKRRDIRPNAKMTSPHTGADQQTELAQLYADYESLLAEHELIDDEGALLAARNALANNACRRFQDFELIVVDGFTDFSRTEHDILRLLSQNAKNLWISLPGEQPTKRSGDREDLFAKTTATLNELQRRFPQLELRETKPQPLSFPAVDFLTGHIFRQPKDIPAPPANVLDSLPRLEIVEAAGAQDEINQIARRIKMRLVDGAQPGDILVVFRSLADAAPRIREVFPRFGIPHTLDAGQPLIAAPIIKTLLSLLRLAQEDWPFRRVVSVITNISLSALNDDSRRAADWLVRDLQIASGRNALLNRVQSLAADATSPNDRSEHLQRRVDAATAALPSLTRLSTALDELPASATPTEWCAALTNLATQLALPPFAKDDTALRTGRFSDQCPPSEFEALNATDQSAWHSILTHFNALERLDTLLGEPVRKRSRSELLSLLLDISTNERLSRTHDDAGRVRVVASPAARNITAKHVFLAGMSEQAFPSPERAGNLATEADYRKIEVAAHGDSGTAPTRAQAEMLLFYEVLSRAEETLTISYPALDDKAQTLPPSPYIVEVERVVGKDGLECIRRSHPHLSPVPKETTPHNIPDWRIEAVAGATKTDGDRHLLAGILACQELQPLAGAIDAGLRIVHARARGESFGEAEGLLTSPAIAARLAERFGPKHAWSASQWETYATCPFRFFMRDVLALEPLGDLALETDFARRGSRLHDVLAEFYRQWDTVRDKRPLAPDEEAAAFLAHLQTVIKERTAPATRVGVDAALLELDQRQILKWANRHYEDQAAYNSGCAKLGVAMKPTYFEFRFGSARRSDGVADANSTTAPFVIDLDGEPIQITGQIDRIDVGELGGKKVFNVIDYKSGRRASLKSAQLETGQQLQLPIYVEAAQALLFRNEASPLQAGYWGMGSGFDSRGALAAKQDDNTKERWKETQSVVRQLIGDFIRAIRHGDFPVASRDDKCTSTCDFHMTCRVAQVRSLDKTWWPELKASD